MGVLHIINKNLGGAKMQLTKTVLVVLSLMLVTSVSVAAQPKLPDAGMTPANPFYFLDTMFDGFQSPESLADEKAAEMVAMAERSNDKGLEKARERYEKAMNKREKQAQEDENLAEEVARQSSNHMAVLARVREKAPEQARAALDKAINRSSEGRNNALNALEQKNRQRAGAVAKATLEEVIANAPDSAKKGLRQALEAQEKKGSKGSGKARDGSLSEQAKTGETPGKKDKGKSSMNNVSDGKKPEVTRGKQKSEEDGLGSDNESLEKGKTNTENRKETSDTKSKRDASKGKTKEPDRDMKDTENGNNQENFRMLVSDAPADIADFEYLNVHLSKTRIISGEGASPQELELEKIVDLTDVVGDAATHVLSTELEPGVYKKVGLYVASVDAKTGNTSANVKVPSNKLQIVKQFEVTENNVTSFVFDINVVRKGKGNEYNLLPVISESGVVGKDIGKVSEVD